jgi:hypothetical protein
MIKAQTEQLHHTGKGSKNMKANLKKIIGMAALGMTLLVNTVPTWAGEKDLPEVEVGPTGTYAGGSMVGARYSDDKKQYIGCTAYMSWAGPWTSCFARDKTGTKYFLCNSGDPKWHQVLQAMTDSSKLYMTSDSGTCNYISVENKSSHLK